VRAVGGGVEFIELSHKTSSWAQFLNSGQSPVGADFVHVTLSGAERWFEWEFA
jgi:hypothetical protein